jgi:methylated-DNA-[protein]-cysteine S-methyltransferase
MQKMIRYAVFRTKWGYFGLAGTENALLRSHLPLPEPRNLKRWLLKDLPAPQYDKTLFNTLQKQIIAYFEGTYVNFDPNIPIVLDGLSQFAGRILTECRNVKFGRTISYGQLAQKAGRPNAARGVGRVMANNPLPLIIPCHRVIRSDGRVGGFSAKGGTKLKSRLLQFEQKRPSRSSEKA